MLCFRHLMERTSMNKSSKNKNQISCATLSCRSWNLVLEGSSVYLDGSTSQHHLASFCFFFSQCLCALFKVLAELCLSITPAKFVFAIATVIFLSLVIEQGCVGNCKLNILTKRISIVPFGWYRTLCKSFSKVVFPLTEKLKAENVRSHVLS